MSEVTAPADGATVVRWRRFGHDRLYVKDASGAQVGYWDLGSGTAHPDEPAWRERIEDAAARWYSGRPAGVASFRVEPVPGVPPPVPKTWTDLAANKAGQLTRARARAERQAAPVRTILDRVLRRKTEERSWRLGAVGEERVGKCLDELAARDPRWRVLHSVPVGSRGSDIDHVLVGPGGIFTVNTKHHPKARIWVGYSSILVNRHHQPYVRKSRFEASRVARILSEACGRPVRVEAMVVPVGARVEIRNQPHGVHVVPLGDLSWWTQNLRPVLEQELVAAVYEVARRSTTWC